MKFLVKIKEVHSATLEIEADSEEEAFEKASEKIAEDYVETQYDYTLDQEEWTITKA